MNDAPGSPATQARSAGPATRAGSPSRHATALMVAAGSGQRLGAGGPKALVEVGGRPMFEWSLDAFRAATTISAITVATPPGRAADFAVDDEVGDEGPMESGFADGGTGAVVYVDGGESRSHSVANALAMVETDLVLVHDAARPLVTAELIDACVNELAARPEVDCVIAAAPVTDTIKAVDQDGIVIETLDRSRLRAIQTPQVFRTRALREALEGGDLAAATDDASLIESNGGAVAVLQWTEPNVKITTSGDLDLVEHLLHKRNST